MARKPKNLLRYVITCHTKHVQLKDEDSYLIRIVNNLEEAIPLMEGIYRFAEQGRTTKFGAKYSDPKWLDEHHHKLQVTADININGWLHSTSVETYALHDEWDKNIFNDKPWILE